MRLPRTSTYSHPNPGRGSRTAAWLLTLTLGAVVAWNCGPKRVRPGPPAVFPLLPAWTVPLDEPFDAPLVTDGTRIFVISRAGRLRAIEGSDGRVTWERSFAAGSSLGGGHDVLVLREPEGQIQRLDPANGSEIWSRASGIPGAWPPTLDGDRVVVAGAGVAALDLATGRALWGAPVAPQIVAPASMDSKRVYLAEADGGLRARDRNSGESLWEHSTQHPLVAAPVVDERYVYVGTTDRRVQALRLENGRPRWSWRVGTDVRTPGLVQNGLLLVASLENVLYALDGGNGHLAWRAPLPSRAIGAPLALPSGALVACRESDLIGFDLRTGQKLGTLRTPGELRQNAIVLGESVVVGLRGPWAVAAFRWTLTARVLKPIASPSPRR